LPSSAEAEEAEAEAEDLLLALLLGRGAAERFFTISVRASIFFIIAAFSRERLWMLDILVF
jgi:hypothetical protein